MLVRRFGIDCPFACGDLIFVLVISIIMVVGLVAKVQLLGPNYLNQWCEVKY